MKNNSVVRAACKFIHKELKGKKDVKAITQYLQSIGYFISSYDIEEENELILKYRLDAKVKTVHAFTIVTEESKTVYVCNMLSAENRKYAIIHETGHIILGHLDSSDFASSDRLREMEADTFAYAVLNYEPSHNHLYLAFVVLTAIVLVSLFRGYVPEIVDNIALSQSVEAGDMAYLTPTGSKYHRESCVYVQNKDCIRVEKDEAQRVYGPCSICNP